MTSAAKVSDLTVDELRELIRAELGSERPSAESYVGHEAIEKHYGVSRATLHNWVHKEGCPHVLRGKVLRFQLTAVESWFRGRGALKRVK